MSQIYEQYNTRIGSTYIDRTPETKPLETLLDELFGIEGSYERVKYNEGIERWLESQRKKQI